MLNIFFKFLELKKKTNAHMLHSKNVEKENKIFKHRNIILKENSCWDSDFIKFQRN